MHSRRAGGLLSSGVLLLVVGLLSWIGGPAAVAQALPAEIPPASIPLASSPPAAPKLSVVAGGVETVGPTWHYAARYPVLSGAGPTQALSDINAGLKRSAISLLLDTGVKISAPVRDVPPASKAVEPGSADVNTSWVEYVVQMLGPRYVSVFLRGYAYNAGGAHGFDLYSGATYDLLDGSRVAVDDLFESGADFTDALAREFMRTATFSPDAYVPSTADVADALRQGEADPGVYALTITRRGLRLDITSGWVSDNAEGPKSVTIPWSRLTGIASRQLVSAVTGHSPLDHLTTAGVTAATLGLPGSGGVYQQTLKRFGPVKLWTRGRLPFNCLRYRTPCLSAASGNLQAEYSAQALAVRELSRRPTLTLLPGAPANQPRNARQNDPVADAVDWETVLVNSPGKAPGGAAVKGTGRSDIIADGRAAPSYLFEVKLYAGPATVGTVTRQLTRYLASARTLGVTLTLGSELFQAHWVEAWVQPNVDDPLDPAAADIYWAWAPETPGHLYYARGDFGRRQAHQAHPDVDLDQVLQLALVTAKTAAGVAAAVFGKDVAASLLGRPSPPIVDEPVIEPAEVPAEFPAEVTAGAEGEEILSFGEFIAGAETVADIVGPFAFVLAV